MSSKNSFVKRVLLASLLATVLVARAEYPPYEVLSDLEGYSDFQLRVSDVSADGRVVVGAALSSTGRYEAWRWEEEGGFSVLGFLAKHDESYADRVAADGSAVIGRSQDFVIENPSAFRWTSAGGIADLSAGLPTNLLIQASRPVGISADGKVVVGNIGYSISNISRSRGFRWTPTGFSFLVGPTNSNAEVWALSQDGLTAVGRAAGQVCRWNGNTLTLMGNPPGADSSYPLTVSSNGLVIAGEAHEPSLARPFVWTPGGGMVGLALPAGATDAENLQLTSDGTKLFGNLYYPNSGNARGEPFVWTSENGMKGLGMPEGMRWAWLHAISADGATLVGFAGTNSWTSYPFESSVRHYYWTEAQGWRPIAQERAAVLDVSADGRYGVGTVVPPGSIKAKPARWLLAPPKRAPVIFIHGVAGSVLKTGPGYIWPTVDPEDVADLHLINGPAGTEAVDVVREYDVGGLGVEKMQFYGPFLQHMTQAHGYVEFRLEEDRSRLTNFFLLNLASTNKPDLFTFPYDWRRPNASHVATLHTFIQRVRELHDGAKVNLVVHSMGGLVMRRYLLEYGTESINSVVTVGSPIWGAPESAFRMFTGIFFGVGPIDFINSSAMKESVLSMPAVHELNPSTKYLQHWGFPVFTEVGTDYNDNGIRDEGYSASEFRVALDEEAAPQTPASNNIVFHGYLGGRQDDWSQDDGSVGFLHIIGKQAVDVTTVGIEVRSKTFVTPLDLVGSPNLLQVFSRMVGEGDGTVPTLGSQRLPQYYAPRTLVREITEPLPGVLSAQQPADLAAEHTMLMSNTNVWKLINEFLDTGTLAAPAASGDGGMTAGAKSAQPRRQVLVMGCGVVSIRDGQAATNTIYGGIAARQIPGVEVIYNKDQNWVLVEFDENRDLVVESAPGCEAVEIEVTDFDVAGDAVGLRRYRAAPGTNRWQLALAASQPPSLAADTDRDGTFEPQEEIAPSHAASGPGTDVHPPEIEVLLSRVNGQIQLSVNGSDAQSPPVTIRYSLNGAPLSKYTGPIHFEGDSQHSISLFGEDALGNTSGLIQTRLNPELKIGRLPDGSLSLEWPLADGYRLESAPGPLGPWTEVTATRMQSNSVVTVEITADLPMSLFRLRK